MTGLVDIDAVWRLLLAAAARRRAGTLPPSPGAWCIADDAFEVVRPDDARAVLVRRHDGTFEAGPAVPPELRDVVELYLPMLGGADTRPFVIAHLGQSIDAAIASTQGKNDVITGPGDFEHMHRLRALADAVLVGAGTVAADDPRLTVRLVDGPDPVRVVLDPDARLERGCGVFRDGAAPTLRVCGSDRARHDDGGVDSGDGERDDGRMDGVDTVSVPFGEDGLSLEGLLELLRARGLRVIFIEGGGVTVTRWMEAGLLDRLHLVAAPVLLGNAVPGLQLHGASSADGARRPPYRLYQLGHDVLWDFDLRGGQSVPHAGRPPGAPRRLA